jgi:2-C-methyl-D-erythritol 4-phosphate cytidylyltransferase
MTFGAILAGGVGSRMHVSDMPKQFLLLGDKPIIIHTVEKFLLCSDFDSIYIGVHQSWTTYMEDLLCRYLPGAKEHIKVVCGGADRNETIQNIISQIEQDHGSREEDIVVTHDAVRPFVTLRMIEENIEGARQYGAVDTVVSAVDTIVASSDGTTISDIPIRDEMYQGQTPQSFRVQLLKELYQSLSQSEKQVLTDACKICVVRDYPVHLVEGAYTNLKITTPVDYKIAQAMMGGGTPL